MLSFDERNRRGHDGGLGVSGEGLLEVDNQLLDGLLVHLQFGHRFVQAMTSFFINFHNFNQLLTRPFAQIYTTLKTSTSPPTTTKKGSESRDYIFGTLFGLLSIARSSILSDGGSSAVLPFLDLATNLYSTKKWLRETGETAA